MVAVVVELDPLVLLAQLGLLDPLGLPDLLGPLVLLVEVGWLR
tara:strand:- start:1295 stop:1423 length:129 start_codon:yes stop_codon:yes gene_type:complete